MEVLSYLIKYRDNFIMFEMSLRIHALVNLHAVKCVVHLSVVGKVISISKQKHVCGLSEVL